MNSNRKELLSTIRNLKEYKTGLKLSNSIHENLDLVGRKNKDTLQQWHELGNIVERIKTEIGKRYGNGLMTILAKEYSHDGSDLNRAARFARLAPDYKVFQKEHPDVSDLRKAVRTTMGTRKDQQEGRERAAKVPTAKAVAKHLEKIEDRFNKLLQDFFALLSDEQDTTEVEQGFKRIQDTLEKAFAKRPPEIDATASQIDSVRPVEDDGKVQVVTYHECDKLTNMPTSTLSEMPMDELAGIVEEVVKAEGPIHVDDLVERVRHLTKQKRMGKSLRGKIQSAIEMAAWERQSVSESDGFVLAKSRSWRPKIRIRRDPKYRNLAHICDDELRLAAQHVQMSYRDSDIKSVAQGTLLLLGFNQPRKSGCDRVQRLLEYPSANSPTATE